ncbi:MAG: glucuronate isomerase, partial [Lachnospiraceae bacterium]|nr:glucuronate isomerase [Lachnospiraceae bacterium]
MKKFMDSKDFLLSNDTSKRLYEAAAKMPIIDYHCHINPREIAEDRQFNNITEVWLGGDHYKWRQMRSNGIEEKYITGDASDYEKFEKWTETLQKAIGNPLYHWSHLELQRYFGFNKPLSPATCKEAWDFCNKKLNTPEMSVRNLIKMSNVDTICTTDDPADTLEWHKMIKEDKTV